MSSHQTLRLTGDGKAALQALSLLRLANASRHRPVRSARIAQGIADDHAPQSTRFALLPTRGHRHPLLLCVYVIERGVSCRRRGVIQFVQ
jgi:hypothetical protein